MSEKISETYLLVFLPVKSEHKAEFLSRLADMATYIAKESQFISATIHEDQEDADTIILYERWSATREQLSEQLQRPYRAEYERLLAHLLKSERRIFLLSAPIAVVGQQQE